MIQVSMTVYYYILLLANMLIVLALVPITFEIIQQKITSNIPYSSLIFMIIAFLIYLFVSINRLYPFHIFIYFIGLLTVSTILFLKRNYDINKIKEIVIDKNYIVDESGNATNNN